MQIEKNDERIASQRGIATQFKQAEGCKSVKRPSYVSKVVSKADNGFSTGNEKPTAHVEIAQRVCPRRFFRPRAGKLRAVLGSLVISVRFCRQMGN